MNLLVVVTTPPDIYDGCSAQKPLWEEKFTLVNMTSYGGRNVRKHREHKKFEQYISLETSFEIVCMEKREFASSELRDYMGISGKEMNNYLDLRTKTLNKKQKARIAIADITNQNYRRLLK